MHGHAETLYMVHGGWEIGWQLLTERICWTLYTGTEATSMKVLAATIHGRMVETVPAIPKRCYSMGMVS